MVFERDESADAGAARPFTGVHALQERVARRRSQPAHLAPHAVDAQRRGARAAAGRQLDRACRRSRRSGFDAHEPRGAGRACRGMSAAPRCFDGLPRAHRPLPRARATSRRQGPVVPVGAPALRHGLDARARRVRARALAAGRTARRGDLAVRARLARVLCADPLAPPARRRGARSSPSTTRSRFPNDRLRFAAWREGAHRLSASSTPRCASSTPPATCTTACA